MVQTIFVMITAGSLIFIIRENGLGCPISIIFPHRDRGPSNPFEWGAELPSLDELPRQITKILPENPVVAMVEARMMHIVIFSIFIGIALLAMSPKKSKPLLELLGSLQAVCLIVVGWAMKLAPLAVFGLMAKLTSTIGLEGLVGMAGYVGTVLLGLLLLLVFYLLIVAFIGKRSPWTFLKEAREVQLLAFSTSSSAAVMPLSLKTAEDGLKIRPSIAQFMIPLGATSNMDGTALYQGVATVFLAQVFGLELSVAALALVVFTAVMASIGAPATPGVGIVILASVLESAGIPGSGVALIIGVDRILDMSRCVINVTGDLTACTVMDRFVGGRRLETGEDLIIEGEETA
jgi:Na+/H+-dicarboxylate symporter